MNLPKNNCSFCKHLSFNRLSEEFEYNVSCVLNKSCEELDYICEDFEKEPTTLSHNDLDIAYNNFLDIALRISFQDYSKSNYYKLLKERAMHHCHSECSICGSTENLELIHLNQNTLGRESLKDITIVCEDCLKK